VPSTIKLKPYPVTRLQYDYIEELLGARSTKEKEFIKYVLVSSIQQMAEYQGTIPIYFKSIEAKWGSMKRHYPRLREAGLLEYREHQFTEHRSREYQIPFEILERFQDLAGSIEAYQNAELVNLYTGRAHRLPSRSQFSQNGHAEPTLVKNAMAAFRIGYLNVRAIESHLSRLQADYHCPSLTDIEYQKRRLRYLNDKICFRAIWSQQIRYTYGESIAEYVPSYRGQKTGRIGAIGGGLQSCSRAMKKAAYSGIEGVRNYDLVAAQANILLEQLQTANIPCPWLEEYLANPQAKQAYAARVGIPVEVWKKCFYAIAMGGTLPTTYERFLSSHGSIREHLKETLAMSDDPEDLFQRFRQEVLLLASVIQKWSRYLQDVWAREHGRYSGSGLYIRNAVGKSYDLNADGLNRHEQTTKLVAHILQGAEAAFIHNLTILGSQFGYTPIANEHDGLVVIGEIPQDAVDMAKRLSGISRCIIQEKPFEQD
jgi:hypothetical protein